MDSPSNDVAVPPPLSMPELQRHLKQVAEDPELPLDDWVFRRLENQVEARHTESLIPSLLPQLLSLLPKLRQDPKLVVDLIIKLLESLSFTTCLEFTSPAALIEALNSPSRSINDLALHVLLKAQDNASEAAMAAGIKDLVAGLIGLWLSTPEVGIAELASKVIVGLLTVDYGPSSGGEQISQLSPDDAMELDGANIGATGRGQGLMWRRVFGDRNVYRLLYSLTSVSAVGKPNGPSSNRQATLAQARLLAIIPALAAIDFDAVARSHAPDVERLYELHQPGAATDRHGGGLLDYAAVHMVKDEDDILLQMALLKFFEQFIDIDAPVSVTVSETVAAEMSASPSLRFMISRGLHTSTLGLYLSANEPKVLDSSYFEDGAAFYLATYALRYPRHFMNATLPNSTSLSDIVMSRLVESLDPKKARSVPETAHVAHLHVMTSLPRQILLMWPQQDPRAASFYSDWCSRNPVANLPNHLPLPGHLTTLAQIFHGPACMSSSGTGAAEQQNHDGRWATEAAAARAMYLLYTRHQPSLFQKLVRFAETAALKHVALAAIYLITSIITAEWAPLPVDGSEDSEHTSLLTEERLRQMLGRQGPRDKLPASGVEAILTSPAVDAVLPFLCSRTNTTTHPVPGGGDVESAAVQIADAKTRAWKFLLYKTRTVMGADDGALRTVYEAVMRGESGASTNAVGSRIETLDL